MPVCVPGACARPAGLVDLGVLTGEIPPELVDEVIGLAGCREKRRRLLPARAVVYFVLGLCLFSGADSMAPPGYRSVMRWLTSGLRHLHGMALPTSSALTRARQRLGAKPFELLFDLLRGPLARPGEAGSFAFGLRLVAWDGTGIDAAATDANAREFGVLSRGGNPQVRLVTLVECGTRALIDAAFDGLAKVSEPALARRLLASLDRGMLLLADRSFPGFELWGLAAGTGAQLLWRIRGNLVFPPVTVLPDGSYLSVMRTPADNLKYGRARAAGRVLPQPQGHPVRVIEYTVTVRDARGHARTEPFRLITTLLDHEQAPAARLAALYHQRWEIENSNGELKTRLRGASFILRSGTPELTCQELLAFLTVCQALSALRAQAARTAGTDPDRISFTVTIRIARDHAASPASALAPGVLAQMRGQAIRDILADLLPPRRDRACERKKKPPKNTFPARKPGPRPPAKVSYTINLTRAAPPPASTP